MIYIFKSDVLYIDFRPCLVDSAAQTFILDSEFNIHFFLQTSHATDFIDLKGSF